MPELPEVEILRQYFEEAALHQPIAEVEFRDDLNKIFKSSRAKITKNLIGNSFTATERLGKYLFAKISNGQWLHLHFGMTGDLELFSEKDDPPKYTRFTIVFNNGDCLAFRDLRKFGVIQIVGSPEEFVSSNKIGQDLLKISPHDFTQALQKRNIPIKAALLDQKKFAGIGNWIADEMLFNTGIHPKTTAANLDDQQLEKLLETGREIVKRAIEEDTHYGSFPSDFFVNYRKKGAIHPDHPNSPVQSLKVAGRGTFIVPEKQTKQP